MEEKEIIEVTMVVWGTLVAVGWAIGGVFLCDKHLRLWQWIAGIIAWPFVSIAIMLVLRVIASIAYSILIGDPNV